MTLSTQGHPLPQSDYLTLGRLNAPSCGDWPLNIRNALPQYAQQQQTQANSSIHNLNSFHRSGFHVNDNRLQMQTINRGDAVEHAQTKERGIFLGRPLQANLGSILCVMMRSASSSSSTSAPTMPKLLQLEIRGASENLLFLPTKNCTGCGLRIPVDEEDVHQRMYHNTSPVSHTHAHAHATHTTITQGNLMFQQPQHQQPQHHSFAHSQNTSGGGHNPVGQQNMHALFGSGTTTTTTSGAGAGHMMNQNQNANNTTNTTITTTSATPTSTSYTGNNRNNRLQTSTYTTAQFNNNQNNSNQNSNQNNPAAAKATAPPTTATANKNQHNLHPHVQPASPPHTPFQPHVGGGGTSGKPFYAGDAELIKFLKKGKRLGEGAQGVVWQCTVEPSSRMPTLDTKSYPAATPGYLVLKTCRCQDRTVAKSRFDQSVRLMSIKSSHLVPYFAVVYDPNQIDPETKQPVVHVIMPYYGGGNLSKRIQEQRGKFSEQWLLSTMLQLCNALNVLHSQKPCRIVHGDVKPDNVLLFGDNGDQVLLMDLEASSVIPEEQNAVKADNEGTYEWRAPESADRVVSTSSDMWSLGVVAMVLALLPDYPALKNPDTGSEEMLNGESWNDSRLYWSVKDAVTQKGYGERTAEIICSLLRLDPKNRPTTFTLNEVVSQWMETLILAGKF